jgi:CBS domain containing-hemolysin-like protein
MTPLEVGLRLVVGLMLILANGFFIAVEFALTRVRQFPMAEFDTPWLDRAWEMTDDLEIYVTSCQVGITASSIAGGVVAEPALGALFEPLFRSSMLASVGAGSLVAFGILNLVHLTHGEQTPTYLGVERTKTVCRYGAAPLYYFTSLIRPVMMVGDTVAKWTLGLVGVEMTGAWLETNAERIQSRAQLRTRLDALLAAGDIPAERHEEIVGALDAGRIPVESVMVDRVDVVFLSSAVSPAENLDRINETPHTRYPLVGEEPAEFQGIVYVPSVLDALDAVREGDRHLSERAAPPMTVTPATSVSDAIDQFQAERQEMALVVGDGEVRGLVTATDAFEAVMGQLEDPLDRADDGAD